MKIKNKKAFPAFLALLLGFAPPLNAFSIQVTPTVHEVKVQPASSTAGKIQVKNVSKLRLRVSGRLTDWKYEAATGVKKFLPAASTELSAAPWISFSPSNFTVEPGQVQEVNFSVNAPAGASGGHFAAVVFSAAVPGKPKSGVTINVALQMASLVLVEIPNTVQVAGSIQDFNVEGGEGGRPLQAKAIFKNTGNTRVEAKGRLSILDKQGNAVGWTSFLPVKTLPDDEWPTTATWAGSLPPGSYHLVATFELAPDKIIIQEKDIEIK